MFDQNIRAKLVYDGGDKIFIPEEMGSANPDQLAGSVLENLCELSCRVCYDSLGTKPSRSSAKMHEHIKEVKHHSVFSHANLTFSLDAGFEFGTVNFLSAFMNRPGIWTRFDGETQKYRVTCNLRSILEWDNWTPATGPGDGRITKYIGDVLRAGAHRSVPLIVGAPRDPCPYAISVSPETEDEHWISIYMSGSRGFSHEMVRHHIYCAVSQRSTRYVDEDGSPQVEHPLVSQYREDMARLACNPDIEKQTKGGIGQQGFNAYVRDVAMRTRSAYRHLVDVLQPYLIAKGVDKFTARKQARGAARGYLPNALCTEMIFSANVRQWLYMIGQRATVHADAEIRQVFVPVFKELLRSRHAKFFEHLKLVPSPDGIGEVVIDKRINP